jgi:predicted nucleotidyltransferase
MAGSRGLAVMRTCYARGVTRDELIARLWRILEAAPAEIVAVYLYGSWARAEQRSGSDVDLAFWRSAPSAGTLDAQPFELAAQLEAELRIEVDLVELDHGPPDLVHEVLRVGVIVLDRDPSLRVRRELHARAEYLDMLPVLHRYRRSKAAS